MTDDHAILLAAATLMAGREQVVALRSCAPTGSGGDIEDLRAAMSAASQTDCVADARLLLTKIQKRT